MSKNFVIEKSLTLESGKILHPPINVAYETYGKLNSKKDNAILICHALTGSANVEDWWNFMVGKNKPIDTDKYFIICSNVLGSCYGTTGPTSINPENGKPYRLDFPVVTINDMVKVQKILINELGINKLFSVIGGSMGGMQVLSWCVQYPEMVKSAIIIASTFKHNAYQIAFNEVGRFAIMSDPKWNHGNYSFDDPPEVGLSIARMIGHITYLSEEMMEKKFAKKLKKFDFSIDFEIGSYLHYQGFKFTKRFDANSYLYLTKALDYFDLTEKSGSLEEAFINSININYLIVSFTSDWLYPPQQSQIIAKTLSSLGADVSYINLNENFGHDSFLIDREPLKKVIGSYLDNNEI